MLFEKEEIKCTLYVHTQPRSTEKCYIIPCKKGYWNSKTQTEDTRWVDVLCLSNTTKLVCENLDKGETIQVIGTLSMTDQEYTNKDGELVKKQAVTIIAEQVEVIDFNEWKLLQSKNRRPQKPQQQSKAVKTAPVYRDTPKPNYTKTAKKKEDEDDMPF